MAEILLACGLSQETVTAVIMLNKDTKAKVHSPDGETGFFDLVAGGLQGDTLVPFQLIICIVYVLRTLIDQMKENGFRPRKGKKRDDIPQKL